MTVKTSSSNITRSGFKNPATSKIEPFMTIGNSWKPLASA